MREPVFTDVLRARRTLSHHLQPTPLRNYPALDRLLGARVFVKHENFQPTGAFKVRGGIFLMSRLTDGERRSGVVTASTGNHGQSIAYAARLFGVRTTVFAPRDANPVKVEAMESLGAEVVLGGDDFEAAKARCEQAAAEDGRRYISSGDEADLVAGVGTYTLEILEELPEAERILVPVGGGSGAAGACLVAATIGDAKVVGVQAAAAPAAYLTWKRRAPTTAPLATEAEGLATGAPFMMPQRILWRHLDDFLLVEEEAMRRAVRLYLEKTKTLTEPAGAAPLAAALADRERLAGKTVVLVVSGGNIAPEQLKRCLE